ncbi:MAG: DUF2156 domain-containing protein [Clostridia bacterium]|nr:DUF2156 domain-containing protein [Clostridia bacterium]
MSIESPLFFRPLTLDCLPAIHAAMRNAERLCDRTAVILYMWAEQLDTQIAFRENMIFLRSRWGGRTVYSFPLGEIDLARAVELLRLDAASREEALTFVSLSSRDAAALTDLLGGIPTSDDTWSDYLYRADALAELAGRDYHTPRNHLNRFLNAYPNYVYQPITPALFDEVAQFAADHRAAAELSPAAEREADASARALTALPALHAAGLPLFGGVLRAEGEDSPIIGFSLGEKIGDTLFVHIEKGNITYPGVYPMLIRELSRMAREAGVVYLNREEDDGEPGLRRAKQAYRPCHMIEKYALVYPSAAPVADGQEKGAIPCC